MNDIIGDGIAYDMPQNIEILDSFFTIGQCVVYVRPKNDRTVSWIDQQYGFDWIRASDSGIRGDVPYHKNMGIHIGQTNDNSTSEPFQARASVFEGLTRSYFPKYKRILWKWDSTHGDNDQHRLDKEAKYRYYIPAMTLRNGSSVTLSLKIEVDTSKPSPDKITIFTSGDVDNIFSLSINNISNPANNSSHDMTVTCNRDTKEEQHLVFEAVFSKPSGEEERNICGIVRILPNWKKRKLKVLFVNMDFNNPSGRQRQGTINNTHIQFAQKLLRQAMVELDYATETYTMEDGNPMRARILANYDNSSGVFTSYSGFVQAIFNPLSLFKDLQGKGILKKYTNHIIVVFLGVECHTTAMTMTPGTTSQYTPPFTISALDDDNNIHQYESNAGGYILMFQPREKETLVHEILHAVGLKHSFSNSSPYVYRALVTENIMDYSHNASPAIDRISTWQWQWKILWDYCDNISRIESQRFEAEIEALGGADDNHTSNRLNELESKIRERLRKEETMRLEGTAKDAENVKDDLLRGLEK